MKGLNVLNQGGLNLQGAVPSLEIGGFMGVENTSTLLWNAGYVLFVFLVAFLVQYTINRLVRKQSTEFEILGRKKKVSKFSIMVLERAIKYLIYFIALTVILQHFNINLTAVVALLGVGGIAVAFAAQETLANIIAGFVLLTDKPFKVGDRISLGRPQGDDEIGEEYGDVVDVGLRSTRIRTKENVYVTIPNAELTKRDIYNYTIGDRRYRLWLPVMVSYESDYGKAKALALEAVKESPFSAENGKHDVVHRGFGDSGIRLVVRAWIKDAKDRAPGRSDLYERIQEKFWGNGIVIPYPRRYLIFDEESYKKGN